ncbi:uncharacterized protein SPSC_04054 [Sporisorium scitamineum]|uniref:Proteasome assembly chaperone 3 n=1 Tax=Sporisorium scitamineum TaxID=49012 RepID=A0A0F7S842_9BASI|nr:uncharacterized protein SPSC_04054 [Sporisorium scitamineum]CDW96878.1 hypothetical protein [Sporisorium scitamineum]
MMSAHPPVAGLSAIKIDVTPVPASSTPVLPTKTIAETINGHPTTIITQSFADRIFIAVTQLNKFGCLYQAVTSTNLAALDNDAVEVSSSNLPPPLPSTSVSKLVGSEPSPAYTALYQLYVAQIASIVKHGAGGDERPLIVSLALKPTATGGSTGEGGYDDSDDEADSLLLTSEDERKQFITVMEAVQKCRVW